MRTMMLDLRNGGPISVSPAAANRKIFRHLTKSQSQGECEVRLTPRDFVLETEVFQAAYTSARVPCPDLTQT